MGCPWLPYNDVKSYTYTLKFKRNLLIGSLSLPLTSLLLSRQSLHNRIWAFLRKVMLIYPSVIRKATSCVDWPRVRLMVAWKLLKSWWIFCSDSCLCRQHVPGKQEVWCLRNSEALFQVNYEYVDLLWSSVCACGSTITVRIHVPQIAGRIVFKYGMQILFSAFFLLNCNPSLWSNFTRKF